MRIAMSGLLILCVVVWPARGQENTNGNGLEVAKKYCADCHTVVQNQARNFLTARARSLKTIARIVEANDEVTCH